MKNDFKRLVTLKHDNDILRDVMDQLDDFGRNIIQQIPVAEDEKKDELCKRSDIIVSKCWDLGSIIRRNERDILDIRHKTKHSPWETNTSYTHHRIHAIMKEKVKPRTRVALVNTLRNDIKYGVTRIYNAQVVYNTLGCQVIIDSLMNYIELFKDQPAISKLFTSHEYRRQPIVFLINHIVETDATHKLEEFMNDLYAFSARYNRQFIIVGAIENKELAMRKEVKAFNFITDKISATDETYTLQG